MTYDAACPVIHQKGLRIVGLMSLRRQHVGFQAFPLEGSIQKIAGVVLTIVLEGRGVDDQDQRRPGHRAKIIMAVLGTKTYLIVIPPM